DGKLGHRRPLPFGEVANLGLCEGNVGKVLVAELRHAGIDLGLTETEVLPVPVVELTAEFAHSFIAALLDVAEDAFHGRAYLAICLGSRLDVLPALQPFRHWVILSCVSFCIRMQTLQACGEACWESPPMSRFSVAGVVASAPSDRLR